MSSRSRSSVSPTSLFFPILVIGLLLVLTGCAAPIAGENPPPIAPQVLVIKGEPQKRLIRQEEVDVPNCNGSADATQDFAYSHTVQRTVELGGGITVDVTGTAGVPGIGSVGVGAEVANTYNVGYGTEESLSRSVNLAAGPGTHMLHTIRLWEIWETGNLVVVAGNNSQQLPYSFRRDFSIERLEPADIGCPPNSNAQTGSDFPIATPEPFPTAIPESPSPSTVTRVMTKVESQMTGDGKRLGYQVTLAEGEMLAGQAYAFNDTSGGCVAFQVVGPGNFTFAVENGIYHRWQNTDGEFNARFLQEQVDTLVQIYNCNQADVRVVRIP